MLGLEHVTSRGSIMIEYYGRDIGVKIMPTGVNPDRFLDSFGDDTLWRREELLNQVHSAHFVDSRASTGSRYSATTVGQQAF